MLAVEEANKEKAKVLIGEKLRARLNRTVVVESKSGAGGTSGGSAGSTTCAGTSTPVGITRTSRAPSCAAPSASACCCVRCAASFHSSRK